MKINQYDVFWTDLNPTQGAEINKIRPCVVVSPPEMNHYLQTVIIVPVTSRVREGYPTRLTFTVGNVTGEMVLDQIRAIDKTRLREKIGCLTDADILQVKSILKEMLID